MEAIAQILSGRGSVGLAVVAHTADLTSRRFLFASSSQASHRGAVGRWKQQVEALEPDHFRLCFYPGRPTLLQSRLDPHFPVDRRELLVQMRKAFGGEDLFGAVAHPDPGLAAVVYMSAHTVDSPGPADHAVFRRLAGHLESALRLRLAPERAIAAVLSPCGRLLDAEPEAAPDRERLSWSVENVERSRLRPRRREQDAIADWEALVEGRYSLVPREDSDGKRYYLAVLNPPTVQAHARWTATERRVVQMAARGFSGKATAHDLGITPGGVSRGLRSAAARVGIRSRTELTRVAASFLGSRGASTRAPARLTAAERDVVDLLVRGLSNAEIAQLRQRSVNTVANQVATILRKTGAPTRRAISALAARDDEDTLEGPRQDGARKGG